MLSFIPELDEKTHLELLSETELVTLVLDNSDTLIASCYEYPDDYEYIILFNPILVDFFEDENGMNYMLKVHNVVGIDEPMYLLKSKIVYANNVSEPFEAIYQKYLSKKAVDIFNRMNEEILKENLDNNVVMMPHSKTLQ